MAKPERRITPRFKLHTPLTFHRKEANSEGAQEANAINISTRGVYFASSLGFCVGEALQVSLEVPKRVTGSQAKNRCFVGRVTTWSRNPCRRDNRESAWNCFVTSLI